MADSGDQTIAILYLLSSILALRPVRGFVHLWRSGALPGVIGRRRLGRGEGETSGTSTLRRGEPSPRAFQRRNQIRKRSMPDRSARHAFDLDGYLRSPRRAITCWYRARSSRVRYLSN